MDDRRFDDLARVVSGSTSRRGMLGAIAAVLLGSAGFSRASLGAEEGNGGRAAPEGEERRTGDVGAAQRRRRNPCKGKNCPKCQRCVNGKCRPTRESDGNGCGPCRVCDNGSCVADVNRRGEPCGGCKRCSEDGQCMVEDPSLNCRGTCCRPGERCTEDGCCPDPLVISDRCCPTDRICGDLDVCCPEGQKCQGRTNTCCKPCKGDQCCAAGETCIDPGVFAPNSCCNTSLNTPCGDNGDGTFKECCSNANEECCNGECVTKGACPCPDGAPKCNGKCCDSKTEKCHQGACRDICSVNPDWNVTCKMGDDYWCCHPGAPSCCYLFGKPHCCA